ncbi:AraC family transcriptional regulator [Caenibius tardaugens]|uniref:AraC family transcriptional regulator n=1 Tax=Caenibius tardaugens TaxID=169176 RepID=UPI000592DA3B
MLKREIELRKSTKAPGARPPTRRRTVPAEAVAVLLEALDAIGGDVDAALKAAGLRVRQSGTRTVFRREIDRVIFARLAQECVLAFHYHACRRDGLKPLPVRNLRLMCLAMLACPNLRIAIETAGQFQHMALDGRGRTELIVDGQVATFVLDTGLRGRQVGDMLIMLYGLAMFHRIFGWFIHEEIQPDQVLLAFPEATSQPAFRELFELDPEFDQPFNGFRFPARILDRPIERTFEELSDLFALFPFDLLPPDYENQTLVERTSAATYAALSRNMPPPALAQLADMFGLSTPTFRRRLQAENDCMTAIRNRCRQQLAERLLIDGTDTVKEIAFRLQFSDVAAFRRAFRAWTGLSPQAFRQARLK